MESSKLAAIKIDGIEIVEKALKPANIIDDTEFKFSLNANLTTDPEKKLIVIFLRVFIKAGENEEILASFLIAMAFYIENYSEVILIKDKKEIVPQDLNYLLRDFAISTARGILFSELRGTILHKAILPVILAKNMVTQPN